MDADKGAAQKRDVVLLIPTDGSTTTTTTAAAAAAPKLLNFKPDSPGHQAPELAKSGSPNKQPRSPQSETLIRLRSFAKPKSRFDEQPASSAVVTAAEIPPVSSRQGSPNPKAPSTPKSPSHPGDVGEETEEEDEVNNKRQLQESDKRRRKWKVRIMLEWAILVLVIGCLISSLTVRKLHGVLLWSLKIWQWCLMVAVICCGRLVTHWLVTLLVFLIERNFLLRKKVLYFVFGLKNSVKVCIWLGLVSLTWCLLFRRGGHRSPTTASILDYITRVLASLLVASVLWLVKTLLVKILASSFHMSTFFDRIQMSIFNQYLLQTLSGPPVMEMAEQFGDAKSNAQLSFRITGKGKGKGKEQQEVIDMMSELHRLKQEKVSAWTMRGLINVIGSSGLSTISNTIENLEEEGGEQRDQVITNECEAKEAANRIFKNVAKPYHKYIDVHDLLRFLSKEEVEYLVPLFEGAAESGKIKKSTLKNWVVKAYRDRKSLAHSLNDTKTAIKQLHKLASAVAIVVIIIITLLLMDVASTKYSF